MVRLPLSTELKEFIRWAQKDTCLLCSFPLVLHCHFHHVISVKDCGPEDPLNLVGLCPNHHGMIENLKKTKSPSSEKLGSTDRKVMEWSYKIGAARKIFDGLDSNGTALVNLFLEKYPDSSTKIRKVFVNNDPCLNVGISRIVIDRNIEIYKKVNRSRPRIYFQRDFLDLSSLIEGADPYDLLLLENNNLQEYIDKVVEANMGHVKDDVFDYPNILQFLKLGLDYFFDHHDNLHFKFSDHLFFTMKQLREMSNDEYFELKRNGV